MSGLHALTSFSTYITDLGNAYKELLDKIIMVGRNDIGYLRATCRISDDSPEQNRDLFFNKMKQQFSEHILCEFGNVSDGSQVVFYMNGCAIKVYSSPRCHPIDIIGYSRSRQRAISRIGRETHFKLERI